MSNCKVEGLKPFYFHHKDKEERDRFRTNNIRDEEGEERLRTGLTFIINGTTLEGFSLKIRDEEDCQQIYPNKESLKKQIFIHS